MGKRGWPGRETSLGRFQVVARIPHESRPEPRVRLDSSTVANNILEWIQATKGQVRQETQGTAHPGQRLAALGFEGLVAIFSQLARWKCWPTVGPAQLACGGLEHLTIVGPRPPVATCWTPVVDRHSFGAGRLRVGRHELWPTKMRERLTRVRSVSTSIAFQLRKRLERLAWRHC